MGPVSSLIGANKSVQNALIAADRLFEIMDLETESSENKIDLVPEKVGDIVFQNIFFSYGTRRDVFADFSIAIPHGKLTAIIGESGSGKTTPAALLQKLYPLSGGKITINGLDIDYISTESLRNIVGTVPQQLNLFSGSIVENIAVGDLQPDMQRVITIIQELGLMPFIEKLPEGLATQVGENGVSLSGGEKQRIAIARALYRNPQILIFDEATSSLDSQSEQYVKNVLHRLSKQGNTIILIAHRLSTVVDSDLIVVLEDGKLIEQGSHIELYQEGTRYHQMWQKQMI